MRSKTDRRDSRKKSQPSPSAARGSAAASQGSACATAEKKKKKKKDAVFSRPPYDGPARRVLACWPAVGIGNTSGRTHASKEPKERIGTPLAAAGTSASRGKPAVARGHRQKRARKPDGTPLPPSPAPFACPPHHENADRRQCARTRSLRLVLYSSTMVCTSLPLRLSSVTAVHCTCGETFWVDVSRGKKQASSAAQAGGASGACVGA